MTPQNLKILERLGSQSWVIFTQLEQPQHHKQQVNTWRCTATAAFLHKHHVTVHQQQ